VNGLARDLHLVLLGDVGLVQGAAAVGQTLGKGASWTSSIWSGSAAGGGPWGHSPYRACGRASWAGKWAVPWRSERPGACRRGSRRRVGGAGARFRLAAREPVGEEFGSWHTEAIPYRNYTPRRDVQLHR
jgi:hypothetical protein